MIRISKIEGADGFNRLRDEWIELHKKVAASPFLSWEWTDAWRKNLGGDREITILTAHRNDELIAILPLGARVEKILGLSMRRAGFLGEELGGADYLDLVAAEHEKDEVWSRILPELANESSIDAFSFEYVAADSAAAKNLGRVSGFGFRAFEAAVCPQIDLSAGWEQVLRGARRRDNFKRRLKKLEKLERFEFRSVTATDEIAAAFERFAELHERRWEADGGSEATGLPQLMDFHRDVVAPLAERGLVRFDELWVEGECRASVYGLDDGRTFFYYNAGYDLDWADRSVGLVLIGCSVRAACERGNSIYDFLRGDEKYKFDWSNTARKLVTLKLNRPRIASLASRMRESLRLFVRDTAREILPADAVERLRNFRRNRLRARRAA